MKFLLLALFAVAAAEPEADSYWGSYSPYASTYSGLGTYNQGVYGNRGLYNRGVYSGFNGFYGNQYRSTYGYVKRDADSDSESHWGYNTLPYASTYGSYNGLYNRGVYSNGFNNGFYGQQYQYPTTHYGYAKRDADAEPWNVYSAGLHQPFYNQYQHYQYRAPVAAQVAAGPAVLKQGTFHTNYANALKGIHTTPFAGQVYQPTYNTFVKRDADAEPAWPYTTGYSHYNYNAYNPVRTSFYGNGFHNVRSNMYNNGFYY